MDYMDQGVPCSVCGKETSMIVTKVCMSCEKAAKEAQRKAEWDAKSDVEKAVAMLQRRAHASGGCWLEGQDADFVISQLRAAALADRSPAVQPSGAVDERARFEADAKALGMPTDGHGDHYSNIRTRNRWLGWQAHANLANAAVQPVAGQAVGEIVREENGFWHFKPAIGWSEIGEGTKLYTATPAPEQEAAQVGAKADDQSHVAKDGE